jgi:hypothetical protein
MSTGSGYGVCGVCNREIPVKRDGRLRAHLALTSSPDRREQCDGSGSKAATSRDIRPLTRPAAFNAREEWLKADALYAEYQDMLAVGAASYESLVAARAALQRAVADARQLAPWWAVAAYDGDG